MTLLPWVSTITLCDEYVPSATQLLLGAVEALQAVSNVLANTGFAGSE